MCVFKKYNNVKIKNVNKMKMKNFISNTIGIFTTLALIGGFSFTSKLANEKSTLNKAIGESEIIYLSLGVSIMGEDRCKWFIYNGG